jgi:hypothetical protein
MRHAKQILRGLGVAFVSLGVENSLSTPRHKDLAGNAKPEGRFAHTTLILRAAVAV